MKIVHIESGLGNQMLSYCEYLVLKKMNPNDDIYLETIVYDIPECNDYICQWNGYELERIFSVKTPKNIKSIISDESWGQLMLEIRTSEFWVHNWNYPVAFTKAFNKIGIDIENIRGDFDPDNNIITGQPEKKSIWQKLLSTRFGYTIKRYIQKFKEDKYIAKFDTRDKVFYKSTKNIFTGQWLSLKYRGNDRHLIDDEIRSTFKFPEFIDTKNIEMQKYLEACNSVAIHARRGDMLSANGWCYRYGYFKRAVKYIKKNVTNPVFVFFTNTGSIDWCKENAKIFGLDFNKDKVLFVDWNVGENSYRDMQLMGHCKHAIITNSSFGWWGAYFITNPDKITISPNIEIDTTHHC